MIARPRGLAKEYGTFASSSKRNDVSRRRFVRQVGHSFVLRPACGCGHPSSGVYGPLCPDCGGAELTFEESRRT